MSMTVETDLGRSPLSRLTNESRNLLSSLLNTKKILPCICPDQIKRHRDWRGVASLANISSEIAASIKEYNDKTGRVLDLWIQRSDGTSTVAKLLEILRWIDRYDVHDDLLELARNNQLLAQPVNDVQIHGGVPHVRGDNEEDLITFEDKQFGTPQHYHAFVLYAEEDSNFVKNELLTRMRNEGFRMCIEEDLLPGHNTRFAAVARLLTERCRKIILIFSPDFHVSPALRFYTNLAQADGIVKRELKLLPIELVPTVLPANLRHYFCLKYSTELSKICNFWVKLRMSLETKDLPRLHSTSSTQSAINITEITEHAIEAPSSKDYLALPSVPRTSSSLTGLDSINIDYKTHIQTHDTKSLSPSSEKKKKNGYFTNIFSKLKGKKHKKAIMLPN
ncbi:myeloid differentiation primary response protein MyD88-A [Pieris rapae]|uniref:myeloid differentiation primary response protein MyD88-A n=1 Tax=Pieris rapae TaxID=64459 RepID=UPI001E27A3DC|nr:myeloid differentiation primary response protein MyD88-A [Pieris rapae]